MHLLPVVETRSCGATVRTHAIGAPVPAGRIPACSFFRVHPKHLVYPAKG